MRSAANHHQQGRAALSSASKKGDCSPTAHLGGYRSSSHEGAAGPMQHPCEYNVPRLLVRDAGKLKISEACKAGSGSERVLRGSNKAGRCNTPKTLKIESLDAMNAECVAARPLGCSTCPVCIDIPATSGGIRREPECTDVARQSQAS